MIILQNAIVSDDQVIAGISLQILILIQRSISVK